MAYLWGQEEYLSHHCPLLQHLPCIVNNNNSSHHSNNTRHKVSYSTMHDLSSLLLLLTLKKLFTKD